MARATPLLNNFTAGELSPLLDGRADLAKYFTGLWRLVNMIVFPHGGATRRAGLRFLVAAKYATKKARLLPFQFSTTQAYIIEMGDYYMRFFKDQGIILWTTDPNLQSCEFNTDLGPWQDRSEGGSAIAHDGVGLDMNLTMADDTNRAIAQMDFNVQSPDSPHIFEVYNNAASPLYVGVSTNAASWNILALTVANTGTTEVTFTPSDVAGVVTGTTIYLSIVTSLQGITGADNTLVRRKYYEIDIPYAEADLPLVKYAQDADTMFLCHPSYAPLQLTRTGHQAWTLDPATFRVHGGTSPFITADNYPSVVTFFEQRSAWAATNAEPQTIWISQTAQPLDMSVGDNAASAMKLPIYALAVNKIQWMVPLKVLLFGTTGGEWRIGATTTSEPVTPDNVNARQEGVDGSIDEMAVQVKDEVLFTQLHGQSIHSIGYQWDRDAWLADDLALLSEHVPRGDDNRQSIIEMSFQQMPHRIVWMIRSDGVLIGFTYNRSQEVSAWHRHTTTGDFESVATIPGETRDESYFLVSRTIAGSTARFIELMEDERIFVSSDARLLDAHLTYVGDNASSVIAVSGLEHLEGHEVSIVTDGGWHPLKTVSSGSVTLDNRASVVVVGLHYDSQLTTMRAQAGAQMGTAHGKLKRVGTALIHFRKSAGCEYGVDEDTLDVLPWRKTTDYMDKAPDLIDEIVEVTLPGGYERAGRVTIKQTRPLPLTILSIVPTVDTSEI